MNLASVAAWASAVFLLFVTSFGVGAAVYLIATLIAVIGGVAAAVKSHSDDMIRNSATGLSSLEILQKIDFRIMRGVKFWDPVEADRTLVIEDKPLHTLLTGYPEIDWELNQLLQLFERDYISNWYNKYISSDKEFTDDVDSTLRSCVRLLSENVKCINRVSYLTTHLVDDFASHIRLYRLAIEKQTELKLEDPNADLHSLFFELEHQMEKGKICRQAVCTNANSLNDYATHLVDVLMYLLLPNECFANRPIRLLVRSALVNTVFLPLLHMFSDPDYVNQLLIWSCQKLSETPDHSHPHPPSATTPTHTSSSSCIEIECFLSIIRMTDSIEELTAVKQLLDEELVMLRSRDTGGDDDFEIKQQINSLIFLDNIITNRIVKLKQGLIEREHETFPGRNSSDSNRLSEELKHFNGKLISLPFEAVIKNNVALTHFTEFMSNLGSQGYVFFFLNVEGFRVLAEQAITSDSSRKQQPLDLEFLRPDAVKIYETYLSPDKYSSQKLELDEQVVKNVAQRLKNEPITEDLFDESVNQCFVIMRDRETFYPAFQKSICYVRMLQDLDLFHPQQHPLTPDSHFESTSPLESEGAGSPSMEYIDVDLPSLTTGPVAKPWITVEIDSTGVVREFGNAHAVYAITVSKREDNGTVKKWCSLRRYSDFFTFHNSTIDKYPSLSRLQLPAKRTLSNNLTNDFLEQRRHLLNAYLQQVIRILVNRKDLPDDFRDHVLNFLEPGAYKEKEKTAQVIGKAVDKLVLNPFKSMGEVVRASSETFKDKLSKLSTTYKSMPTPFSLVPGPSNQDTTRKTSLKVPVPSQQQQHLLLHPSPSATSLSSIGSNSENSKVAAQLDLETEENIPLRIMLLLLDEVFDLKSKNQWLRRRIIAVVQQIIQAMSGDSINKKIVDYVEDLSSPSSTAEYIRTFRKRFWPNGRLAKEPAERSESVKRVTAVVAKSCLISSMPDDIKHMIGSETTRKGLLRIFDMFQDRTLNKRLVMVLVEGLLLQIFPDNYLSQIFQKLHSCTGSRTNDDNWPPFLSEFLSGPETLKDTFKSVSSYHTPSNRSSPVPSISSHGSRSQSLRHRNIHQ